MTPEKRIAKLINFQPEEAEIIEGVMARYNLSFTAAVGLIVRDWKAMQEMNAVIMTNYGLAKKED